MDILNWLYLNSQQLIKKTANNAKTDLVVLGAEVPFTKRDDGYQDYAMTLADAVHAGCTENNTYKAGIYDVFPWPIEPSMLKTCTRVEDTPAFPTALPVNLQGYKVGGTIELFGDASYSIYIGSVEVPNTGVPIVLPWKTTGTVSALYETGPDPIVITSPLSLFVTVIDSASGSTSYAQIAIAAIPYTGPGVNGYDLIMFVDPTSLQTIEGDIEATVSFEFEFLIDETLTPSFIIYP
jgi:hypothetical protein